MSESESEDAFPFRLTRSHWRSLLAIAGQQLQATAALTTTLNGVVVTLNSISERLTEMSDVQNQLQTALDQATADIASLTTTVQGAVSTMNTLAADLAAALAAAQNAGATPAQLAELQAIHTNLVAQNAALAAAVSSDQPTTVTGGQSSVSGGGSTVTGGAS